MKSRSGLVVVLSLSVFGFTTTQAGIVTFSGDTTNGPTYNRLLEDLSELSPVGTAVAYSVYSFTVGAPGSYSFLSTASFDNITFLYGPRLNSAMPLVGALLANDDLLGSTTSGFTYDLKSGSTYSMVTTGFENSDHGQFVNTIGGPGAIAAVPEISSLMMLAGGLAAIALMRRRREPI